MGTVAISALAATWNAGGTTFTGIGLDVTDTASAAGSLLMDLKVGGASRYQFDKNARARFYTGTYNVNTFFEINSGLLKFSSNALGEHWRMNSDSTGSGGPAELVFGAQGTLNWRSTNRSDTGSNDLTLYRDAADTLALRRSTNAQAFRVYKTYTDASNYERLTSFVSSNTWYIQSEAAGTGTARPVRIAAGDVPGGAGGYLDINSSGSFTFALSGVDVRWQINAAGHLMAGTDNTYDIGASGATRPRNLYMASWLRMAITTVASLPAAATAGAGARMFVSDALTPVFGSAVTDGGAVTVPVYSTGSAWNVG